MAFRIGDTQSTSLGQLTGVGGSVRVRSSDSTSARLNSSSANNSDAATVTLSQSSTSRQTLTAPGTSSLLETRQNALSTVSDLRAQQLELSQRAEDLAVGREFSSISDQLGALEEEIARVSSSATFNGENVLQGGVYGTYDTANPGQGFIVSVADSSSLTESIDTTLSVPADAISLSSQFTDLISDTSRFTQDTTQAQEVAQAPATSASSTSLDSISNSGDQLSVEEAEALAQSITQQLSQTLDEKFGGESSTQALIDSLSSGLTSDRVAQLTQE